MDLTELTEDDWDAIEQQSIEGHTEEVITFLLVLDGVKPGSEFIVQQSRESEKSVGQFLENEKENHNLFSILTNHNIPHLARMEIQENMETENPPSITVFYSLDEKSFRLLYTPTNEPRSTGEGKFFGFPKKSVKAFEENTHIKSNTPQQRRFLYRFQKEYSLSPEKLAFLEIAHLAPAQKTQSLYEKWALGKEYTIALLDIAERFDKEFLKEKVEAIIVDIFEENVKNGKYGVFEVVYSVKNDKGAKTQNTVYIPAITSNNAEEIVLENERDFIFQTYMSPDMAEIDSIESAFCTKELPPYRTEFITGKQSLNQQVPTMTIESISEEKA